LRKAGRGVLASQKRIVTLFFYRGGHYHPARISVNEFGETEGVKFLSRRAGEIFGRRDEGDLEGDIEGDI
jgi:hypothetical protein